MNGTNIYPEYCKGLVVRLETGCCKFRQCRGSRFMVIINRFGYSTPYADQRALQWLVIDWWNLILLKVVAAPATLTLHLQVLITCEQTTHIIHALPMSKERKKTPFWKSLLKSSELLQHVTWARLDCSHDCRGAKGPRNNPRCLMLCSETVLISL